MTSGQAAEPPTGMSGPGGSGNAPGSSGVRPGRNQVDYTSDERGWVTSARAMAKGRIVKAKGSAAGTSGMRSSGSNQNEPAGEPLEFEMPDLNAEHLRRMERFNRYMGRTENPSRLADSIHEAQEAERERCVRSGRQYTPPVLVVPLSSPPAGTVRAKTPPWELNPVRVAAVAPKSAGPTPREGNSGRANEGTTSAGMPGLPKAAPGGQPGNASAREESPHGRRLLRPGHSQKLKSRRRSRRSGRHRSAEHRRR